MPKKWIRGRERDFFWRLAKEKGYRSRAAFKLLQANESYKFLKPGYVVVDLGAAPGGWMQVARELVGDRGYVLGVDVLPIEPFGVANVETIIGDIRDIAIMDEIKKRVPQGADAVLCDVSPNISGVWEVDHARQIDLVSHAMRIAEAVLNPRGSFFTKVFQGEFLDDLVRELKARFYRVRIVKPKASKGKSAEIYILSSGLR